MNLTNTNITSVHKAFEEVSKSAQEKGIRVTGSELVGIIPLQCLIDAGKYFLEKQERSTGIPEKELIKIAVKSLGLEELAPFKPEERIIEYLLKDNSSSKLISMSLHAFADETSSESPAPGGGSIAAYMGSLGVSLATMVANLSSHKRGWDNRWKEFSDWAAKGQAYKDTLLHLVDEDTIAFNKIMSALSLPKSTEEEKVNRTNVIQTATKYATEIPFRVMQTTFASMEIIKAMAEIGNPNSVSDAGVGALAARSAVMGAYLNVKINAAGLTDKKWAETIIADGAILQEKTQQLESEILLIVNGKI